MAFLVVTSAIIIVFNLVADVLYGFLDPRIRYDCGGGGAVFASAWRKTRVSREHLAGDHEALDLLGAFVDLGDLRVAHVPARPGTCSM